MRRRHSLLMLPTTAAAGLVVAVLVTEAMHLRHLKGHAQAALDEAVAQVALRRTETAAVEEAMRIRAPGTVDRVIVAPVSERETIAVAELTLPSAWPSLKKEGYREVVTSKVTVQPPHG